MCQCHFQNNNNNNNKASIPRVPFFFVAPFTMDPSWQPVMSAAQRRKQRRLRSWWRHEQQSIAAALATFTHHSALRGQKTARAGEEESETKYTAKFRTTPPPQPELFQLFEEEPSGLRPTGLVEPRGPQERVPRHTVEQMADVAPMVQILDAPVLQTVDQLVDVLKLFDNSVPEQVIDVPKISQDAIPQRTVLCEPQLAEQLVEVPTPLPPTELFIAGGHEWVERTGVYFWNISMGYTQWRPPEGYTASPGRYRNTGQR